MMVDFPVLTSLVGFIIRILLVCVPITLPTAYLPRFRELFRSRNAKDGPGHFGSRWNMQPQAPAVPRQLDLSNEKKGPVVVPVWGKIGDYTNYLVMRGFFWDDYTQPL